jgi:hypothetical protein
MRPDLRRKEVGQMKVNTNVKAGDDDELVLDTTLYGRIHIPVG